MLQISHLVLGLVAIGLFQGYAFAENYQVTILDGSSDQAQGVKLYPETLPFGPSDSITWKNDDHTQHSMTSGVPTHPNYSGIFFKTGEISPGKSATVKIDVKQNFAFYYFCEIHPWITGKLVVTGTPEAQPETKNPIVTDLFHDMGDEILATGQVHDDFGKTPYDILIYQNKDDLVSVEHGTFEQDGSYTHSLSAELSPGKYTLKVVYGLPTQIGIASFQLNPEKVFTIPNWIKNEARWWSDGSISDSEFVKAIEFLAKENVIKIQKTESSQQSKTVPAWLKTSAGWWSSGQITDEEFAKSLQYLANNGIIQL